MQAITPEPISILGVAAALFLQLLRMRQATMQAIGELRKDTARGIAELRERMGWKEKPISARAWFLAVLGCARPPALGP